jgi:hypothetical protein
VEGKGFFAFDVMPLCFHRWSTLKRWCSGGEYHLIQRCRKCNAFIRKDLPMDGTLNVQTAEYVDQEKFNAKAMLKAKWTEERVKLEKSLERQRTSQNVADSEDPQTNTENKNKEADNSSASD